MTLAAGDPEGGPDNRHRGADQWLFVAGGVDPTVTLVANSIPYLRGRLQRGEAGAAGLRQRRPRPPITEPHHIDRRCRQEVLKVGLCLTDIATLSQPAPADRLLMRSLDARPGRVPRAELLSSLRAAGPLQRLVMLTRLQPDDPRLLHRLRALRPRRTRPAILTRKPCLENHAVLGIRVQEPRDALCPPGKLPPLGPSPPRSSPCRTPRRRGPANWDPRPPGR
jgi:hypothetical protein